MPALLICPSLTFAASKEIVELQRDVALLQEQVRSLQRSQDEKLSAIQVLVQQALDAANKANTSVALLQNNLQQNFSDQQKKVVDPVVDRGRKMDTDDHRRQRAARIRCRYHQPDGQAAAADDRYRQCRAHHPDSRCGAAHRCPWVHRQVPAPDPPAQAAFPRSRADTLYQNANRDRSGGNDDLALQEFNDYLKYYGNTMFAPNAQFYIAEIHLKQNKLDDALQEFDMVLEKYPDNNKTADALYMKGATLVKMGKRTQGKQEFCELAKRFPSNDLATKAKSQVKSLGLTCGATAAPVHRKRS